MDHDLEPERRLIEPYKKFAEKFNVGLVATNDVHYQRREDARAHDALICIGLGATIVEENRFRYEGDQYYLRSAEEMERLFQDIPGAVKNTLEIANRCNLELDFNQIHLPHFEAPEGQTLEEYLENLCFEFLEKRLGTELTEVYTKRLKYELGVIIKMGYTGYYRVGFYSLRQENGHSRGARTRLCSRKSGCLCIGHYRH